MKRTHLTTILGAALLMPASFALAQPEASPGRAYGGPPSWAGEDEGRRGGGFGWDDRRGRYDDWLSSRDRERGQDWGAGWDTIEQRPAHPIPQQVHLLQEGTGELSAEVQQAGRVWLYDATDEKQLMTARIQSGERFTVISATDSASIGGRPVPVPDLDVEHRYNLYFLPGDDPPRNVADRDGDAFDFNDIWRHQDYEKDVAEVDRELNLAEDEAGRELRLAYEEARREGNPDKYQEKRERIMSRLDEKRERILTRFERKHGELPDSTIDFDDAETAGDVNQPVDPDAIIGRPVPQE